MKPVCWRICFNESATRTVSTDVPKGNFSYNRCTIVLCERDKRDRKCELEREREKEREREREGRLQEFVVGDVSENELLPTYCM